MDKGEKELNKNVWMDESEKQRKSKIKMYGWIKGRKS